MPTQRTTNSNTPTVATATTALASNTARIGWGIQNQATAPLFVLMGAGASTSVYHVVLKACTGAADGSGGSFVQSAGTIFTGIISVAASGTPSYTVFELAP